MTDYTVVLTWAGELTAALIVLVVVAFVVSRIR
jgi:hypothetical protein